MAFALWFVRIPFEILVFLAGLIVVPFYVLILKKDPPKLWGFGETRPHTLNEAMFRNSSHGTCFFFKPVNTGYEEWGHRSSMEPTVNGPRLVWRVRYKFPYISLRVVWRYNNKRYGEFYWGWKIASDPVKFCFAVPLGVRVWATIGN